jgi:hypothetical protein
LLQTQAWDPQYVGAIDILFNMHTKLITVPFVLGNPCSFLLDGSSCGKIDSLWKLPVRKKMKIVAGKME